MGYNSIKEMMDEVADVREYIKPSSYFSATSEDDEAHNSSAVLRDVSGYIQRTSSVSNSTHMSETCDSPERRVSDSPEKPVSSSPKREADIDIGELREAFLQGAELGNCLVFSHNDIRGDNVLMTSDGVRLVDFEYSDFAEAAYDFGNLFDEVRLDYAVNEHPYFKLRGGYPSQDVQDAVLTEYVNTLLQWLDRGERNDRPTTTVAAVTSSTGRRDAHNGNYDSRSDADANEVDATAQDNDTNGVECSGDDDITKRARARMRRRGKAVFEPDRCRHHKALLRGFSDLVTRHAILANYMWAFWSLVRATQPTSYSFGFVEFAKVRFEMGAAMKKEVPSDWRQSFTRWEKSEGPSWGSSLKLTAFKRLEVR